MSETQTIGYKTLHRKLKIGLSVLKILAWNFNSTITVLSSLIVLFVWVCLSSRSWIWTHNNGTLQHGFTKHNAEPFNSLDLIRSFINWYYILSQSLKTNQFYNYFKQYTALSHFLEFIIVSISFDSMMWNIILCNVKLKGTMHLTKASLRVLFLILRMIFGMDSLKHINESWNNESRILNKSTD